MKSIIFNQHQVNHALKNEEGMFRVVIKPQPEIIKPYGDGRFLAMSKDSKLYYAKRPYQIGKTIFVKENFYEDTIYRNFIGYETNKNLSDINSRALKINACYMKQEYSRLTLRIKSVKVERLQDISEEDAAKEGMNLHLFHDSCNGGMCLTRYGHIDLKGVFATYWNSTHKKPEEKFEASPWVWKIEFKII